MGNNTTGLTMEALLKVRQDFRLLAQQDRVAYLRALGVEIGDTPLWWDQAVMHTHDWERHMQQAGFPPETEPPRWLSLSRHIPLGRVYVWHSAMPPSSSFTT